MIETILTPNPQSALALVVSAPFWAALSYVLMKEVNLNKKSKQFLPEQIRPVFAGMIVQSLWFLWANLILFSIILNR